MLEPETETLRQIAVEKYQLLDTPPEESYDNIVGLVAYICDTPMSMITLIDRNRVFAKSRKGCEIIEFSRESSFCEFTINSPEAVTIIENVQDEERFINSPLTKYSKIKFYAGVPLINPDGFKLGTLCVYDKKPKQLSIDQINAMVIMSKQVVQLLEQRYQNIQLLKFQKKLKKRNEVLNKFASVVSHDLKSPLSNIIMLTEILMENARGQLDQSSLDYLEHMKISSHNLKLYVDGILDFYKSDDLINHKLENTNLKDLIKELKTMVVFEEDIEVNYHGSGRNIIVNRSALMQILINLVTNAIKYNTKAKRVVDIDFKEQEGFYIFSVKDNGDGIPLDFLNKMFDLFAAGGESDRDGNIGTGIGLATVKKMVVELGGEISAQSEYEKGSTFTFSIVSNGGF